MKRVNMVMPEDLLAKIDERAKQLYISRTSYIITALMQKLQADEMVDSLPSLKTAIEELKNIGNKLPKLEE